MARGLRAGQITSHRSTIVLAKFFNQLLRWLFSFLIVEDHASARLALATMLETLSCRVTAVGSGEEAVAKAESARKEGHPYRLAVLD